MGKTAGIAGIDSNLKNTFILGRFSLKTGIVKLITVSGAENQ